MPDQTRNKPAAPNHPNAAALMQGEALPGDQVLMYSPWHQRQGEHMLDQAVRHRRITQQQADSADYLYFPQADGSLFCAISIELTPGLILGTSLPRGTWKVQGQATP